MNITPREVSCEEYERAIIGSYLLDTRSAHAAVRLLKLTPNDLGDPRHQLLLAACIRIADTGALVDTSTLPLALGQGLDQAGGKEYITMLCDAADSAANIEFYIRPLLASARAKRLGTSLSIEDEQDAGVAAAITELRRPASDYIELPIPRLHNLVGGIPPRFVLTIAGPSGHGKTTSVVCLAARLAEQGVRVYVAAMEPTQEEWRNRLACISLGYDYRLLRSGNYRKSSNGDTVLAAIEQEVRRQRAEDPIWFSDFRGLTRANAAEIPKRARDVGAQFFIVDHLDCGLRPERGSTLEESRAIVDILHDGTRELELRALLTTQINRESVKHDKFGYHRPVQPNTIFGGDHKRFRSDVMLGYFRPLRASATKAEMDAVRDSREEIGTVLAPNCAAFNCLKHRIDGNQEGKVITLGFHRSMLTDAPLIDMSRASA